MSGSITLCATPLGNLGDVSDRMRETLAGADVIACEDTRITRTLLSALGLRAPRLISYRADNEDASADGLIQLAQAGRTVVVVADAGMPGTSDPGAAIALACHAAGLPITCVPGPSAVSMAIALAGVRGSRYTFVGFLPRRAEALQHLVRNAAGDTIVAFEAPGRCAASLAAIAVIQPDRQVTICRELTKRHEEIRTGSAADLAAALEGVELRGEITLVLASLAPEDGVLDDRLVRLVGELAHEGVRLKTACKLVGQATGTRPNELYARAVDSLPD